MSSDRLGAVVGSLFFAGLAGGIGGLLFWKANSDKDTAKALATLRTETVAEASARAKSSGGDVFAAVRGLATPLAPNDAIREPGAEAGVLAENVTLYSVSMAVEAGKLVEKKKHLQSNTKSVGWGVVDNSGRAVVDCDASAVPMRPLPTTHTHVTDPGSLEIVVQGDRVELANSRDRERIFRIDRCVSALTSGTLLTVAGTATLTPAGLIFHASAGPLHISEGSLATMVADAGSSASVAKGFGWFFLAVAGIGAAVAAYNGYKSITEGGEGSSGASGGAGSGSGGSNAARTATGGAGTSPASTCCGGGSHEDPCDHSHTHHRN